MPKRKSEELSTPPKKQKIEMENQQKEDNDLTQKEEEISNNNNETKTETTTTTTPTKSNDDKQQSEKKKEAEVSVISEKNFFEHTFGFKETPQDVSRYIECKTDDHNNIILKSKKNNKEYHAGRFFWKSISSFPTDLPIPKDSKFRFNIRLGNGVETKRISMVDVGALQAMPEYRHATFQVASNFNCLEFISRKDSAEEGISKYISDKTQGPAASISACVGTVYRNYFVKHTDPKGKTFSGQLDDQLNLLEEIPEIPVTNGYVHFTIASLKKLKHSLFPIEEGQKPISLDSLVSRVKVGTQYDVVVTSGLKKGGKIITLENPQQRINQVFTAALNMKDVPVSTVSEVNQSVEDVAKFLLRAGYKGTILSAMENRHRAPLDSQGKNKLILTLIGGGVFQNHWSWLLDAFKKNEKLMKESQLDVTLVIYDRDTVKSELLDYFKVLVDSSGGLLEEID